MPITFSSPRAQPEVVYFWFQMKVHIFLIANLKFLLQTPWSFGDMAENVKLIGIPINKFLCIYIIASSPGLHTLFCLWRVNKKLPQGETSQNTFQRSRSISWKCKIHMVKWAHPPLKALMPITFSSPRAQPEVVYFLIPNESPYFSDCKSKISASKFFVVLEI